MSYLRIFIFLVIFSFFIKVKASNSYETFVNTKKWTEIEELGFWLFADKRLSGNNKISCMNCHQPSRGWSDGREKAIGFKGEILALRTPTIIGLELQEEFGHSFFWDGRVGDLYSQALMPIVNPNEMNQNLDELIIELSDMEMYKNKFHKAFGTEVISLDRIAQAIVAFERTLKSPSRNLKEEAIVKNENVVEFLNSTSNLLPSMNYVNIGHVSDGKKLFNKHCGICHQSSTNLSDGNFHDIGLVTEDIGRAKVFESNKKDFSYRLNQFKHKTPTLWGVAQRAGPYMHNGSKKSLRDVLEHYNNGGSFKTKNDRKKRLNTLSPLIRKLNLTNEELDVLEQFITEEFHMDFEAYPLPDFLQEI
ncbi:MAG: hypothetical protein KDD58_14020 [Bdellovibrionales bacterium]|nr:hypothetical protein [Bdellovibrionales bacterium]